MELINDMIGDYIYINSIMQPPTCFFYRDKNILKSESIKDLKEHLLYIMDSFNITDKNIDEILKCNIEEIVLDENGIIKFSTKV